ncbi:hypothetical protein GGI35DRAFT_222577 [Trichoderma velutinum]
MDAFFAPRLLILPGLTKAAGGTTWKSSVTNQQVRALGMNKALSKHRSRSVQANRTRPIRIFCAFTRTRQIGGSDCLGTTEIRAAQLVLLNRPALIFSGTPQCKALLQYVWAVIMGLRLMLYLATSVRQQMDNP